jgi:hypothetical protein
MKGNVMKEYLVEIVHEPSGSVMSFTIESDVFDVTDEILSDLSVIVQEIEG